MRSCLPHAFRTSSNSERHFSWKSSACRAFSLPAASNLKRSPARCCCFAKHSKQYCFWSQTPLSVAALRCEQTQPSFCFLQKQPCVFLLAANTWMLFCCSLRAHCKHTQALLKLATSFSARWKCLQALLPAAKTQSFVDAPENLSRVDAFCPKPLSCCLPDAPSCFVTCASFPHVAFCFRGPSVAVVHGHPSVVVCAVSHKH